MKFELNISAELQKKLARCTEIDRVAPAMLDEAAPVLIDAVKARISDHSTAGGNRSKVYRVRGGYFGEFSWRQTGSLAKSLKGKNVKRSKGGGYVKTIEFTGYDNSHKKPVANSVKAIQLEYGNSAQAPTPFRVAAMNDCKDAVAEKMQEVYNREMGLDK